MRSDPREWQQRKGRGAASTGYINEDATTIPVGTWASLPLQHVSEFSHLRGEEVKPFLGYECIENVF